MKEHRRKLTRSIFSLKSYVIFFLLISFTVTCSFMLFLNRTEIDEILIRNSAKITFINILFLSFIFCVIDGLRRQYQIARPVNRILEAAEQLADGDFSVRIQPIHEKGKRNEFDLIIENFNTMASALEGIETLQTDFISNVSHELQTPLAVIENYGVLLQSPGISDTEREIYAKAIIQAARRLSQLITNILKLSKLENQQIFLQAQEINLGEEIRGCILGFIDSCEGKNITIKADIGEIILKADGELLNLVWNNLLSNAVKFTPCGGTIFLRFEEAAGIISFTVQDTGCGMTEDVGKRIFEKFYQGDSSHGVQGNGLGLALVKRVIDIVGGEITVSSTEGQGSTFTVRLRRN